jgi:hypothetical protein
LQRITKQLQCITKQITQAYRINADITMASSTTHWTQPTQSLKHSTIHLGILLTQTFETEYLSAEHSFGGIGTSCNVPFTLWCFALMADFSFHHLHLVDCLVQGSSLLFVQPAPYNMEADDEMNDDEGVGGDDNTCQTNSLQSKYKRSPIDPLLLLHLHRLLITWKLMTKRMKMMMMK